MVKMTYSELLESFQSINDELLKRKDLANKPALFLRRVCRVMKAEVQGYDEQRQAIFDRYAEEVEGRQRIAQAYISEYQVDLNDLVKNDVELDLPSDRKLTKKDLGNKLPSPYCMDVLDWLLDIPDEDEEAPQAEPDAA